ncbi:myristylated IMV envelope protein [Carp edema virus]|nr:myristylated IMV envelope protein [Carp edema virus]
MGTAVSTQEIFNNINTQITNGIASSGTSVAESNCTITIGSIVFDSATNCNIRIKNACSSNAKTSMDSIMNAVQNTINGLDQAQKQAAAAALGTLINVDVSKVSTNIYQEFNNYITQNCNTASVINNVIKVDNIRYGKCFSLSPTTIEFLNTGQAVSNCIMKTINQVQIQAQNNISTDQSSLSTLGGIFDGLVKLLKSVGPIIVIGLVIVAVFFLVVKLVTSLPESKKNLEGPANPVVQQKVIPKSTPDKLHELKLEALKNEPIHWSLAREFLK